MIHEPSVELGEDKSAERKSKLGIKLFFVYLIIYAGFVLIGTMWPKLLGNRILMGSKLSRNLRYNSNFISCSYGFDLQLFLHKIRKRNE
jgi:hypothetical protein